MLPQELIDLLNEKDPEDIDINITSALFNEGAPRFSFEITTSMYDQETDNNSIVRQEWTITATGYRTSKIHHTLSSSLEITDEHPILWLYSDMQSELYFSSPCKDPNALFYDLYETHRFIFENLIPFEDSLNPANYYPTLMESDSGLLAQGPRKLMEQYAVILEKHQMSCNIIGERIPTYWDGEKQADEKGNLKVLFIDHSYIIAEDFAFSQRGT